MKALPRLAILASVSLTSFVASTPARAALVITEVMSSSGVTGAGTGALGNDWFELTNTGTATVDLTGFKMDDNSNSFALAAAISFSTLGATATLAPGQSQIFLESTTAAPDTEVANFRTYWGGIATGAAIATYTGSGVGLSSTADQVNIFDAAGNLQTGVGFGVATTGVSFDNRAGAATLTVLSAAGVNGAYNAANPGAFNVTDVGSPGAVPEPAAYLWLGLGALAGLSVLRARRVA